MSPMLVGSRQRLAPDSRQEQQDQAVPSALPCNTDEQCKVAVSGELVAAVGAAEMDHKAGALPSDAAEPVDYLDIPRRVSCERAGSRHKSRHFEVDLSFVSTCVAGLLTVL